MDAVVTLKISVKELDLLRDAIDTAIENEVTTRKLGDLNPKEVSESRARQVQLTEIQQKLR